MVLNGFGQAFDDYIQAEVLTSVGHWSCLELNLLSIWYSSICIALYLKFWYIFFFISLFNSLWFLRIVSHSG